MLKKIFKKILPLCVVVLSVLSLIYGFKNVSPKSTTIAVKTKIVSPPMDTVTKLSQMRGDTAIFKKGNRYTRVVMITADNEGELEGNIEARTGVAGSCSQIFAGKARAAAKLSYAAAPYQTYSNTTGLRATFKSDSIMQHSGLTSSSPRIAAERRNVLITKAYLYGISREGDDDFHCIVGDVNGTKLVNCEISGLPPTTSPSYAAIKTVRDYVVKYFGSDFCVKSGYTLFQPALPITIKGSLFYDIDHKPGTVGPAGFHPPTSWEIHPINDIHF